MQTLPAVRAFPQPLEMTDAVVGRSDTGKAAGGEIVGRIARHIRRDDRKRRYLAK